MAEAGSTAIVYTRDEDMVALIHDAFLALGGHEVHRPASQETCVEALVKQPHALLALDWQFGSEVVNQILGAIRGHFRVETRPILLVIPDIDENILCTAAEYSVSQVHSGPLSLESLSECLKSLIHEDESTRTIREALVKVQVAREKGDWAIATPLLLELWDQHTGNERVATELAENLIYEGSWDQAVALLTPLVESDPPHVRALHLLGRCRMRQGRYEEALKLLERGKIINPHNIERLIDLGNVCLRVDKIDQAMGHFDAALALDDENQDATVGKGQCHLLKGEVNEALTLLKEVSGPRELASIFNTSAILAMRQARHEQGMQLYRSALQAIGQDDRIAARLMYNMGLGYRRWQKPDKAAACFAKSLELDPAFEKAALQQERLVDIPHDLAEEAIGQRPEGILNEEVNSLDED